MKIRNLLSGVSLGVLTLAVAATPSVAQEQLPTIDVGAARPVAGGSGRRSRNGSPGIAGPAGGEIGNWPRRLRRRGPGAGPL